MRDYTHPSVLAGIAAGASWADPTMDPRDVNWARRRAVALVPFPLVDGRPVNPLAPTGVRFGRNLLGHWGEQACADAVVTAITRDGRRWLLLIERRGGDGTAGWALPGGYVEPGESAATAAVRELAEETGLTVPSGVELIPDRSRVVPDPRQSDEAWMTTTPVRIDLGVFDELPPVAGCDDAGRAVWVPADTYYRLVEHLLDTYGGAVFPAHQQLLVDVLT